jgi:hypothetical protein
MSVIIFPNRSKPIYNLANPPKDSWFIQKGAYCDYIGSISKCGEYVVRICDGGVIVDKIEVLKRNNSSIVHPTSVTISST